jgi:hypothetical protein
LSTVSTTRLPPSSRSTNQPAVFEGCEERHAERPSRHPRAGRSVPVADGSHFSATPPAVRRPRR